MAIGIYVHIPFCVRKCAYCDFLSFSCDEGNVKKYIHALQSEIKATKYAGEDVDTVFIGGGTPSFINAEYITEILAIIREKFNVDNNAEITVEGNPDSLTLEKLKSYRAAGVNRISMGFQSLDNDLLGLMGRVHDRETALRAFENARTAGFENVNVDLIFGLPGDDREAFKKTLETVVSLRPEHISAYSLIVEEGTKICGQIERGELPEPDDDFDRDDYHFAVDYLKAHGYNHYEISNFALPGFESRHNVRYWKQDRYVGFGLGASSFMGNRRFSNCRDFAKYVEMGGTPPLDEDVPLTEDELRDEFMMLGYRMTEGPNFGEFQARYGVDPTKFYSERLEKLVRLGLLDNDFKITAKGLDFANEIFEEYI